MYLIVAGFGEQLSLYDVTQMNGYRVPRTVTGHRVPLEKEANPNVTGGMGMFISGNLNTKNENLKQKTQSKFHSLLIWRISINLVNLKS